MRHEDVPHLDENDALQYVAGLLDAARAAAVEAHVAGCDECRFLLAEAGAAADDAGVDEHATRIDVDQQVTEVSAPARPAPSPALAAAAAAARRDARIGVTLNDTYVIESLIGRGGMGAVYRARHRLLPKHYAIKLLGGATAQVGSEANEAVERMRREAEVTSRLKHPHIVEVVDFNYADDGTPFIVMELLEGESLSQRIKREAMEPDEVVDIATQVAGALDASHRAGIVHRDLKPTNVFLTLDDDGATRAKVMDFGISKVLGVQSGLTGDVSVMGSPRYMAPEQARGRSAEVDQRADIFALGVILFEMLAGEPPFVGDSVPETLYKVVYDKPARPKRWRAQPRALREVVLRALSKEREQRQPSMAQLVIELREAAGFDVAAGAAGFDDITALVSDVETQPVPSRRGSRPALLVAALATIVAAAVVLVFFVALGPTTNGADPGGSSDSAPRRSVAAHLDAAPTSASSAASPATSPAAAAADSGATARSHASAGSSSPSPRRRRRARRRRVRFGSLTVQSKGASDGRYLWATVYLDGRKVGQTALTLRVRSGAHRVAVRRAGYRSVTRRVWVRAGRRTRVRFALRKR